MHRRAFLTGLTALTAGYTLDLDRLLWASQAVAPTKYYDDHDMHIKLHQNYLKSQL